MTTSAFNRRLISTICMSAILAVFLAVAAEAEELPVAPPGAKVYFRDSFMRENPEAGEWSVLSGEWSFDRAGKPGISANPFSLRGMADEDGFIVVGYKWWRDYIFGASIRTCAIYGRIGVISSFRDTNNYIFFGFDEAEGIVLYQVAGGKKQLLASRESFPVPHQWYKLRILVKGKKVYATIDGRLVFTHALSDLTCGKGGIHISAVAGRGVTVDDCEAMTVEQTAEDIAKLARNGFEKLFQQDRLTTNLFPQYFTQDSLMRKWASADADWLPYDLKEPDEGEGNAVADHFTYPLPIFNDLALHVKFPGDDRAAQIIGMTFEDEDERGDIVFAAVMTARSGKATARVVDARGNEIMPSGRCPAPVIPSALCGRFSVTFDTGKHIERFESGVAQKVFKNGLRVLLTQGTQAIAKIGHIAIDSSSVIEESFFRAPSQWMTVYGRWEIAARWSCSPQYTYLSSWDRATSQLYSKHRFGGKVYAECWLSPKMTSFRWPGYLPLQWFSMSLPDEAGDLSRGLTAAVCYPDSQHMSVLSNGKTLESLRIADDMKPWSLHELVVPYEPASRRPVNANEDEHR
ncbi:MAG: hypothetical protein U5N86_10740 [Planctomycetota bacterium]|nr:hypothetical protein [Planctomycetota bacterium]